MGVFLSRLDICGQRLLQTECVENVASHLIEAETDTLALVLETTHCAASAASIVVRLAVGTYVILFEDVCHEAGLA